MGVTRWYIDTRGLTASTSSLPLLSTLQPSDQPSVQRFYHLRDRHMSLASQLLKYLFIHQTCRVPWDQVLISRTPAPHNRPCYVPIQRRNGGNHDNDDGGGGQVQVPNIEFNVSHQASMVALAGCIIQSNTSPSMSSTTGSTAASPTTSPTGPVSAPQIGIDITCTDERGHRNKDSVPSTEAELHSFIDIFAEVFCKREIQDMKKLPANTVPRHMTENEYGLESGRNQNVDPDQLSRSIDHRLRRFYTYWALKEAYIKMTGEALLAPWLRQLEFADVVAPDPGPTAPQPTVGTTSSGHSNAARASFGVPYTDTKILLHGQEMHDVRIEVVGLGEEYLFATAARGRTVGRNSASNAETGPAGSDSLPREDDVDNWTPFRAIDIDADIAPCATGRCDCLRASG